MSLSSGSLTGTAARRAASAVCNAAISTSNAGTCSARSIGQPLGVDHPGIGLHPLRCRWRYARCRAAGDRYEPRDREAWGEQMLEYDLAYQDGARQKYTESLACRYFA